MRPLRILHISDLHERVAFDGMPEWRRSVVDLDIEERGLVLGPKFLDAVRDVGRNADLICFTGDVADWGHPAEFDAARLRVEALLAACDVPPSRFFAVPGNHDVQRSVEPGAYQAIIKWLGSAHDHRPLGRWLRGDKTPVGLDAGHRDEVLKRTAAFWDWMTALGRADLVPRAPRHLGYRSTIPAGTFEGIDLPVHICGLDSAWLCGADDDQGRILVTDEQVLAQTRSGPTPLDGLRIALVHHPLDHLRDHHNIRRLLVENKIDLLLHGHQHEPLAMDVVEPGASLRVIASGCLMEGDRGKGWPNGFHLIELCPYSLQAATHFRKWVPGRYFWTVGSDLYATAPSGTLLLSPTAPPGQGPAASSAASDDPNAVPPSPVTHDSGSLLRAVGTLDPGRRDGPNGNLILGSTRPDFSGAYRIVGDPPPALRAHTPRRDAVATVVRLLHSHGVVSLVGPPGAGKTNLARLAMEEFGRPGTWIHLRDQHVDACVDAIRLVVASVARSPIVVIDDLPRVASGSLLETELARIARAVAQRNGQLVILSHNRLPPTADSYFAFQTHEVPPLQPDELAEYFQSLGAPTGALSPDQHRLILDVTNGLPILVAAVGRFLSRRGWSLDVDALNALLAGAHEVDLREQVLLRIVSSVTSDSTRELLYRLLLVRDDFDASVIERLCDVEPSIRHGAEHLSALRDTWVEPSVPDRFRTATILDILRSSPLDTDVKRRVHEVLGDIQFSKPKWGPTTVLRAFGHYVAAGKVGKAGTVLLIGLVSLSDQRELRGDYGLLALWHAEIPDEVDSGMRLQLRILQIAIAARLRREVSERVQELRASLAGVAERDRWAVATVGATVSPRLMTLLPELATDLMGFAVASWGTAISPLGEHLPADAPIEELPAILAGEVETPRQAIAFLEELPRVAHALSSAASARRVELGIYSLTDRLVYNERGKMAASRNWPLVLQALQLAVSSGKACSWAALTARARRAELLLRAEHLNEVTTSRDAAQMDLSVADSTEMRFVLREVLMRVSMLQGDFEQVADLGRALLEEVPPGFELLATFALVDIAFASRDGADAVQHLIAARSWGAKVPGLHSSSHVRILAELSIAQDKIGDWRASFVSMNEAMETVFQSPDAEPSMRTTAVCLWHVSSYLSAVIRDPERLAAGRDRPAPGTMFPASLDAGGLYSDDRRTAGLIIHADHAEMVGSFVAADTWRDRARAACQPGTAPHFLAALGGVGRMVAAGNLDGAIDAMRPPPDAEADHAALVQTYVVPAMAIYCALTQGSAWASCADALERALPSLDPSSESHKVRRAAAAFGRSSRSPGRGEMQAEFRGADMSTRSVALLSEAVREDVDYISALNLQLGALVPAWPSLRGQAGVRTRLLQPLLRSFWSQAVQRSPFHFTTASSVSSEVDLFDEIAPRLREQRLLSVVASALSPGRIDSRVSEWFRGGR